MNDLSSRRNAVFAVAVVVVTTTAVGWNLWLNDIPLPDSERIHITSSNPYSTLHDNTASILLSNELLAIAENNVTSEWEKNLCLRLSTIALKCGKLCTINSISELDMYVRGSVSNDYFREIQIETKCDDWMSLEEIDSSDSTVPYPIPASIIKYYKLDGAISNFNRKHYKNVYLGGKAYVPIWTEQMIMEFSAMSANGTLGGTYGIRQTQLVRNALKNDGTIFNATVLVIGSERPWVEATCLSLGANFVMTLEYGEIVSYHPLLTTITPTKFREMYHAGTIPQFDMIVTFSSVEHSGLGRYGDALNPWGDLLAIARAWCVTKPNGKMLLGVPSGTPDRIEFNGHRVYGKYRWPLISANWKLTNSEFIHDSGYSNFMNGSHTFTQVPLIFQKVN